MMPRYREIQETVHALLGTAFSSAVIKPGVTTAEDVEWGCGSGCRSWG